MKNNQYWRAIFVIDDETATRGAIMHGALSRVVIDARALVDSVRGNRGAMLRIDTGDRADTAAACYVNAGSKIWHKMAL